MNILLVSHFLMPLFAAIWFLFASSKQAKQAGGYLFLFGLSATSLALFATPHDIAIEIGALAKTVLIILDVALLLYFAKVGFQAKMVKIYALALLQLFLYTLIELRLPEGGGAAFVIDDLAKVMFLLINMVGGAIGLFSIRYLEEEKMSPRRKALFQSYLYIFLAVMSLAVSANSLLIFFLCFEITTLFSFLLIGFRKDAQAKHNANRALWMNQIGGVAILLGVIYSIQYYNTLYFSDLLALANPYFMLPFAYIAMAAFVKAASMPFNSWLLGAMVAPTPVSAMLHSATMVKIAPFLILKLSPVIAGTVLGSYITLIGSAVFVVGSFLALSKDFFKEILGLSTIALLGLMIALATIESAQTFFIVTTLMLFHGISKAMLFLSAGILEKEFHYKFVNDFKDLFTRSPLLLTFILFGFASLTLPPFGVFMGKLMAIELLSASILENPLYLIALVFLAVGSTLLVLLYFKVTATLIAKETTNKEKKRLELGFSSPLFFLLFLSFIALFTLGVPLVLVSVVAVVVGAPFIFRQISLSFDRVKEYACGEKIDFVPVLYTFDTTEKQKQRLTKLFIALFVLIPFIGAAS